MQAQSNSPKDVDSRPPFIHEQADWLFFSKHWTLCISLLNLFVEVNRKNGESINWQVKPVAGRGSF